MSLAIFEELQRGIIPEDLHPQTTAGKIIKVLLKAVESTDEMILITDAPDNIGEEKILFANNAFEEHTQYSREDVIGKNPSFLQGPDTDDEVIENLVVTLEQGKSFEGETFNYKKDGSKYRVRWNIQPIHDEENNVTHFVSVQRDITEEWETKQHLKEIVEERETMLKETHHRIKNNLATITGLLELQIMESDSEEVKNILSESMNRVQSIASVHEKLYQTSGLTSINIGSYLTDLLEHMKQSNTITGVPASVHFEHDFGEFTIGARQAVSLGLIINELVTNANKHAFEGGEGTISISCKQKGDQIYLHFQDNGTGFPEDMDIESLESLGMKLIKNLCNQLNADYRFYNDNGANFEMHFEKKSKNNG